LSFRNPINKQCKISDYVVVRFIFCLRKKTLDHEKERIRSKKIILG
jgi:hypothetical protein